MRRSYQGLLLFLKATGTIVLVVIICETFLQLQHQLLQDQQLSPQDFPNLHSAHPTTPSLVRFLPHRTHEQRFRHEFVSKLNMMIPNPPSYRICKFENICVEGKRAIFFTRSEELTQNLRAMMNCCNATKEQPCPMAEFTSEDKLFCPCFTKESEIVFETLPPLQKSFYFFGSFLKAPTATNTDPRFLGNAWYISQWLCGLSHHIAHFSYNLVQFYAALLHREFYQLPSKLDTIVWQDGTESFIPFEQQYWDVITNTSVGIAMGLANIDIGGEVSGAKRSSCPPQRTIILKRKRGHGLRWILNQNDMIELMQNKGIHEIDVVQISEDHSLQEQAQIFASFGLMISSHSSQLANLVFAHENAVVIEASPIFKPAFRHLGIMSRLKYINSVGHMPEENEAPILEAIKARGCDLEKMIEVAGYDCNITREEREPLKMANFYMDLAVFERQLDESLAHLEEVCKGSGGWLPRIPQNISAGGLHIFAP
ncbi:hypothetical protein HDU76_004633 [Blyttiomyces sp. JEL0837]|nr:hypothetical protein HDU76_004633 [Blyttiomyces sp. JEL0837]